MTPVHKTLRIDCLRLLVRLVPRKAIQMQETRISESASYQISRYHGAWRFMESFGFTVDLLWILLPGQVQVIEGDLEAMSKSLG